MLLRYGEHELIICIFVIIGNEMLAELLIYLLTSEIRDFITLLQIVVIIDLQEQMMSFPKPVNGPAILV